MDSKRANCKVYPQYQPTSSPDAKLVFQEQTAIILSTPLLTSLKLCPLKGFFTCSPRPCTYVSRKIYQLRFTGKHPQWQLPLDVSVYPGEQYPQTAGTDA
jgi:hypothetical protein